MNAKQLSAIKHLTNRLNAMPCVDGPFNLTICDPDNVQQAAPSRDLALEAFEDGHQHVVYA